MRTTNRTLVAAAGLALCGAARAQYAIVVDRPGTFTDIRATGVPIVEGDDRCAAFTSSVTNALVYTASLYACTNGFVGDSYDTDNYPRGLPLESQGMCLFPYWDDLYVDPGIGALVHQGVVENGVGVEIIQWDDVRTYAQGPGSQTGSFQVKIFGSGPVLAQFIYDDVSFAGNGFFATIGMQWDGTNAIEYSRATISVQSGMVLSIVGGPLGACCRPDGTCVQTTGTNCVFTGGVYRGDNAGCAGAACPQPPGTWSEPGDAGDTPATASVTRGEGALETIRGVVADDADADMYAIRLCDPVGFSATCVGGAIFDTQLFLFDATGRGVVMNDDDPYGSFSSQSHLTSLFTASRPAGVYYLAISAYNKDPRDLAGSLIWANTPFGAEHVPDGPGAANPISHWGATGYEHGGYTITLAGSCFVEGVTVACYPNCDGSSAPPCLNVGDFGCFLNAFAAGGAYANCDGSTQVPLLTVQDFACFLNAFAAGCSAC